MEQFYSLKMNHHDDRNYIYPIEIFGYIFDRLSDVVSGEVIQLYKR